jgi:hypothetical protein
MEVDLLIRSSMKLSDLHSELLRHLQKNLSGWRYVSTHRHFKRESGTVNWLFHVAFINHEVDFDAVGDVSVEYLGSRKRLAIFGAQLGNLAGVGQTRHRVSSPKSAETAAASLFAELQRSGLPFLQRYSDPVKVVEVLQAGGEEASLISPITALHAGQIKALLSIGQPVHASSSGR